MLKKWYFLIFLTNFQIFTFMLVEKCRNCYNWNTERGNFEAKSSESFGKSAAHILCALFVGGIKFPCLVFIICCFYGCNDNFTTA